MIFNQLASTHLEDTIAEAMHGRELEFFHYDFDRVNFEHMLSQLPDSDYRRQVETRLAETLVQMNIVETIYQALQAQILDETAHQAAIVRTTLKRNSIA